MRKIPLIAASLMVAASLIGFILAVLASAPTQASPGSGAFKPAAETLLTPVADLSVAPVAEPRYWRHRHARWARAWRRPSRPYYEPYAYYPAYRYREVDAYYPVETYAYYPAYERPYSYSYLGRYYSPYERPAYLPGFYTPPASYYYYW